MVLFLYDDLKSFIKSLMDQFVKKEVLKKFHVTNIDVQDIENTMSVKNIDVGYGARLALQSSKASQKDILLFKHDCLKVLKHLVNKLLTKSPITSRLLKSMAFCNPTLMAETKDSSLSRLKACLDFITEKRRISPLQAERAQQEFRELLRSAVVVGKCNDFNKKTDRLDSFLGYVD